MGIEIALITSALLGAIHGANPSSGWLLGAYPALIGGRWLQIPRSILMILAGHIVSSSAFVAIIMLITGSTRMHTAIPISIGVALTLVGLYRLFNARGHPHRYTGLRVGARAMIAWGLASGAQYGGLFLAGPALIVCGAYLDENPYASLLLNIYPYPSGSLAIDLVGVIGIHHLSMLASMLAMGSAVYILGARLLKSLWINYEALLDFILIILGGSLTATSISNLLRA